MPSQEKSIEHLEDHLPYELLMLRHTYERMNTPRYPLDWNAHYESFAVHARNLFDFLTNRATANNFKASHFSTAFKVTKNDEVQRIINQDLHSQVLHLGKNRESDEDKKVGHQKREKVFTWIETNMAAFIDSLKDTKFNAHWDSDEADPRKFHQEYSSRPVTTFVYGQPVQSASTGSPGLISTTGPGAPPKQAHRRGET